MIDFNHGAIKGGVPTSLLLDASAANLLSPSRRPYLGGSRLGEECARKLQYEYLGATDTRPMTAKTHIIFAVGHALENEVAKLLRGAGFDVRTNKPDGSQFGFSVAGDRIRGHIDGVVCGGPAAYGPYPYLWESKWVGSKYWGSIVKKGVAAERPVYAGQVAIYQAYMGLEENAALFSVGNRDTGEIAFERLPFNPKLAQSVSDRGVSILTACEAGEMLPRPYASPDYFACKWCGFSSECWK